MDAAALKIVGLSHNEQIHTVRSLVMEHRALSSTFLSGDESVQQLLNEKKAELIESLEKSIMISNNDKIHINTTNRWKDFEQRIYALHNDVYDHNIFSEESVQIHNELISDLINFGNFVADSSGLVLDDDLSRINIVNSIFTQLPSLADALGLIRANGSRIAFQQKLHGDDEQKIIILLSNARMLLQQTERNIHAIEEFNKQNNIDTEKWFHSLGQIDHFLKNDVEDALLITTNISVSSQDYYKIATKVIDEYTGTISDEMSILLKQMAEVQLKQIQMTKLTLYSGFSVIIMIASYFFQSFYSSIKQTVSSLERSSERMAVGDFSIDIDVKTRDEMNKIGLSLQKMRKSVQAIILDTKKAVDHVAYSTKQLATGSEDTDEAAEIVAVTISEVADGAVTQSESAQLIFKQVNEIHDLITVGLARVEETITAAYEASFHAGEGEKATDAAVVHGKKVTETVNSTVVSIKQLHARSEEIGQIIDVMTTIANQTNLLALNASIEAARAGEQGRGFSIVADEVRKLAEQSNEASKKVAEIIQHVQRETTETAEKMVENAEAIEKQASLIIKGKTALQTIVSHTNKTSQLVAEIRLFLQNISKQTNVLNDSAISISEITEIAASSAEEVVASAEEQASTVREMTDHISNLQMTAETLTKTIQQFKV